jgi:uncharacterized membrane protein YheB (UPF0754 family)
MIQREVQSALDRGAGVARPLVLVTVGSARYRQMKNSIAAKIMQRLPETLAYVEDYARETMDIRNLLRDKMQRLDERQFEALIRPAFEQDEWILIAVGAALGFVMGEVQAQILEHFASR